MDITEKSKEYAKGKAFEAMTAAIEQAYADGYNDGMRHRENLILESIVDGVEYVDLDLPGGKMWSKTYVKDKDFFSLMPYIEASKLNIPTKKDFEDLYAYCAKDYELMKKGSGIRFTGTNGNTILVPYYEIREIYHNDTSDHFHFWLKDDEEDSNKNYAYNSVKDTYLVGEVAKIFMGYKLPVMLVKEVSEI